MIRYYVIYRAKNGIIREVPKSNYAGAMSRRRALLNRGYTDVVVQSA